MRTLALALLSAFAFIAFPTSGNSGSDAKSAVDKKLPSQIAEFYSAYNFVSSFTSESEREQLASYRTFDKLPNQLKTQRLEKVHGLLRSLNARVESIDPGIRVPEKMPFRKRFTCKKLRDSSDGTDKEICLEEFVEEDKELLAVMPSGLIQIEAVRQCSDDTLAVEIVAYVVAPETNLQLIFQYEKSGDKIPSEEQILKMPGVRPISVQVIHRWKLFDGNWMKQEADIFLLEATIASLEDPPSVARQCTAPTKKR
ncbi:MAG: hypothetical protein ACREI9_08180 [Nitrospiraceae bacterium]